jgi:dienelactone hydrolase
MILATIACGLTIPTVADIVTEKVPYEVDGIELEGYVAYDDELDEDAPGVLIVHAWWGLGENAKMRAEMLAEEGYVAFALDMYGKDKYTTDPKQASQWAGTFYSDRPLFVKLATAGLEQLKKQPNVDEDRLAAIGYCFGGTTVMELAYSGADLAGVVSFHGSLLDPTPEGVEQAEAAMLIAHGQADTFYTTEQLIGVINTLQDGGHDVTTVIYSGAEHAFTDDTTEVDLDGASYDEDADEASWEHMMVFFEEIFDEDDDDEDEEE